MTAPDLVVPVEVAVVDPDLLWRVEVMNALSGLMVKDVITVLGAIEHLTPGNPAVLVLGPAGMVESSDQLPELRAVLPEVRVVAVEGPLVETELGELTDTPHLSIVPDPAEPGAGAAAAADRPAVAGPAGAEEAERPLIDRRLAAGSPLTALVEAVHEELAVARDRSAHQADRPYRTLADTEIIVVTSAKGGDGATAVAANLAAAFAAQGRAVGLVEGDPIFGDLAMMLGLPLPGPGTATDPETGIRLVMPPRPAETFEPIHVDRLIDDLSMAETPFDVVVIDAPASIAERSGLAAMADHLLVVCSSHLSSIKNAVILLDVLRRHENVGVVVNRVGRRTVTRHELEETLRSPVAAQLPTTSELTFDRPDQEPTLAPAKSAFAKELARLATELARPDQA